MPVEFTESTKDVQVVPGVTLRVPGFSGAATATREGAQASRRRSEVPVAEPVVSEEEELQQALGRNEFSLSTQVEIEVNPRSRGAREISRGAKSHDMELEVPLPADDEVQVVLAEQDGVLSWHFSESRERAGVRRSVPRETNLFVIPNQIGSAPIPSEVHRNRGIVGAIGKKILKVFVYKVTDRLIGKVSDRIAEAYEKKSRPYGLRMVTPDSYNRVDTAPVNWDALTKGKALLLIHGTFSTAHGAFGALDQKTVKTLNERYGGRMFAFNHHTLSDDPLTNVEWFAKHLPSNVKLNLDILCHSRGGLVARCISENAQTLGSHQSAVTVDRIIMVGVPNEGTVLAEPDNLTNFIDRITNIVGLVPSGAGPLAVIGEFLDGVLMVVKILGHGALGGLPGLASMDPKGGYIGAANKRTAKSTYYAITADYDPPPGNFRDTITKGAGNAVVDSMFEQPNDLVVPTAGVYDLELGPAFPIPKDRILEFPKDKRVMHTTYFAEPDTQSRLLAWLA